MSWIAPFVIIGLLSFLPMSLFSLEPDSNPKIDDLDLVPEFQIMNPKVDPLLLERPPNEDVTVVIELIGEASNYLDELAKQDVSIQTFYEELVQASMPASKIEEIAKLTFVSYIRYPHEAVPLVTSEGLDQLKADAMQDLGFQGEGVKVAVIDDGFDLNNPEIRDNIVDWRSFTRSGNIAQTTRHGTGVAEIVIDVAPKASLLLYNVDTPLELRMAVDHAIRAGAQIISISLAWFNAGPYDGTSSVSTVLDDARARGILPVVSVGNHAKDHWQGRFSSPDGDRWHNFQGADETNTVSLEQGDRVRIFLSWDDWPRSNQNYDLFLFDQDKVRVASSTRDQSGATSPTESFSYTATKDGDYSITIWQERATRPALLKMFVLRGGDLEYSVAAGSVPNLADAKGAVSVGATNWRTGELRSFSSRGPTADGRIKPDVTAPDGVSASAYSPKVFSGTSAAAPHVAGLAALMLSGNPELTADDLQNLLQNGAIDAGPTGRDNMFGSGKTRASFVAFTAPEEASNIMVDDVEYDVSQRPIGFVWSPGSRHTFEVLTTTVALGPGIRTDFQRWINLDQETLTINTFFGLTYRGGPSIFGADFEKQFLLSVESPYGSPEGTGWYKEDSLAFISLESELIDQGNKTRRRADAWVGDTEALILGEERAAEQNEIFNENQTPVLLNSPVTLTRNWLTEYRVSFEIFDNSGDRLRGQPPEITIIDPEGSDVELSEYSDVWLMNGSYLLDLVMWKETDVTPLEANEFTIDASSISKDIEFLTRVYDIEFRVTDALGLPAIEAETRVTTAGGERFFETVDSDGSVFISQVPLEEYEVRVSSLTGTTFVTGDATEGPLEIKVPLGMIGLIILLIVAAIISVTLIVIRRRGKKSGDKTSSDLTSEEYEHGGESEPQEVSNPKFPI